MKLQCVAKGLLYYNICYFSQNEKEISIFHLTYNNLQILSIYVVKWSI